MAKRTSICILLLLLTLTAAVPARAEEGAASPYLPCTITVPAGREAFAGNLTDDNDATRFTLTSGQALSVSWTGAAAGVLLQWYDVNYRATINFYDPEGKQLSSTVYPSMEYRMFLPAEGASRMEILCPRGVVNMASLCEVRVLAEGHAPEYLSRVEPVDLMLVLSGVSEEVDLLGGLLPLYAGEHGIRTAVVYVGRDDGNQVQEAFRALAAMGVEVIPLFLLRDDQATCSIDRLASYWKENQLRESLVSLFQQYAPKVVVTCDPADGVSRVRTPYTGRLVTQILTGIRVNKLPVQKFYHLSQEGETQVDWTQPLAVYDGRTAREVAQAGYACYGSEASFGTVIPESCRFTLAFSRVGEDEAKDDLFEHIPTESLLRYEAPTPRPAATPMPEPTAEPTASLTLEAADKPTAEPDSSPDPNDQYFRQEGDPAEVVIQDYENGHWEYRSDILSVIIDRKITRENNKPYCKYIAHIRMRKVNSYRSIVSSHYEVASASEPPWRLARNFRAVLAITGDNINNADVDFKGVLIRRGILYSDRAGDDTLVIRNDLSMDIVHRGQVPGVDLLDSGVLTTYSFGPTLVENHQISPDIGRHRVIKENPRCGVGMVEPGHFVAIVTDGRDEKRAFGYTMEQFAQVFMDEGVEFAYNLDGGSSSAMVFMGEHVNWHSSDPQRTWADALAWGYSLLVPTPTDPVLHTGGGDFY